MSQPCAPPSTPISQAARSVIEGAGCRQTDQSRARTCRGHAGSSPRLHDPCSSPQAVNDIVGVAPRRSRHVRARSRHETALQYGLRCAQSLRCSTGNRSSIARLTSAFSSRSTDNEPLALGTRIVNAVFSPFTHVHLMKPFGAHIYAAHSICSESIKWQKRLASAKSIRRTI